MVLRVLVCYCLIDNKIRLYQIESKQMQCTNYSTVQAINPLIKLVKQRQELYFQLLAFVNKNIQSSSNDLDNLTIFNKFLAEVKAKNTLIRYKETSFLQAFQHVFPENNQDDPKQIMRLSSRLIEILEASITRVRKGVFDENGRTFKEFNRFKIMLNKILKRQSFIIKDYVQYIVNYCNNKFQKQLLKINKYLDKVQQGEDIWFRELYFKENSDLQPSPNKTKHQTPPEAKTQKKIDITEHLSSTQQQQKKATCKKTLKMPTRKGKERPLNIRNKARQHQRQEDELPSPTKQQVANKLLKFYSLLELNKKEFLEDYIYDKLQQQRHKEDLMNKLLQRNKEINKQINNFVKRSSTYIPVPILLSSAAKKSSGDQRNQSASSKVSLRTSFIISKRKSSFHFESSDNEKREKQKEREQDKQCQVIRNIQPVRRRSSHSTNRPQKSKKLFVVKAPMLFEEEIIPQVQMATTQWIQAPLSSRTRQKRTDNIRLKRKNNPNPLENAFFPQNFRYPL